jgi:hypothetical protein
MGNPIVHGEAFIKVKKSDEKECITLMNKPIDDQIHKEQTNKCTKKQSHQPINKNYSFTQ